jgi:hypothetical protein
MNIESVRALKQEIASRVLPPAIERIRAAGGFSVTTFSLAKVTAADPQVALGIVPGTRKGAARLAVRMQRRSIEKERSLIADIRRRARNEVEFRFVGRIAKHAQPFFRSRVRPLVAGVSAGHFKITAGTIGAFATQRSTGRTVILSNNHVLANENDARIGDAIIQPGDLDDGGRPRDVVARLTKFVRLQKNRSNLVDAAIAAVPDSIEVDPLKYRGLGTLAGVRTEPLSDREAVAKIGRTTGLTRGRVTAIEVDNVVVEYDVGDLSFDDQIEIEGAGNRTFSSGGDSGSAILDEENRICGLLFAGSETGGRNGRGLTYANPIATVLRRLAIELPID